MTRRLLLAAAVPPIAGLLGTASPFTPQPYSDRAQLTAVTTTPVADLTRNWITTPNFPVSDISPTASTPTIPDMALAPGARSVAHYDFRPTGNVTSRATLDADFYYQSEFGRQTNPLGTDGVQGDTGSNFARNRYYPPSNPYNTLNFTAKGLDLDSVCSINNTICGQGRIYSTLLRAPTAIQLGDIVSVTMRTGNSEGNYSTIGLYDGVQHTPGPGGNPYFTYNGGSSVTFDPNCYGEIDILDGYYIAGIRIGDQLKMGAAPISSYGANRGGTCYHEAANVPYGANGPNFTYYQNPGYYPYLAVRRGFNYEGMHTYTVWLRNDGSHLIDFFRDGKLVLEEYYEQSPTSPGWNLVLKPQTVPNFLNSDHDTKTGYYATAKPQDGGPIIGGPWSMTVQEIDVVQGSPDPRWFAAARTDTNGAPRNPGAATRADNLGGLANYP